MPDLKISLLKLQLPLRKLCSDDISFLSNEKHPARQTLIISRKLAPHAARDNSLILKIDHIINNLIQSKSNLNTYSIANQQLQNLLICQKKTPASKTTTHNMQGSEIRSNLNQQIKLRLDGHSIPHDCKTLILKLWPTVLLKIAQIHGFKSKQLYNAFENFSELLESIQPIDGIEKYKKLKNSYIAIARKNNNLLLHFHKETTVEISIKTLINFYNSMLGSSSYGKALDNIDKISVCDKLSSLPENVKPGCWCELFINESTPKRKLKLSFIDIEQGKLVFVNRNGIKTLEKDALDFSKELKHEQSRVINHQELFSSLDKRNDSLRQTS